MASVPSSAGADRRERDRRRHSRCRIIERQLVTVDLGPEQRGLLVDVSLGGAAVQPYVPVEAGYTSNVQFHLPGNGERVDAEGLITWVGPSGRAGIEFTRLSEPALERLRNWIENLAGPAQTPAKSASQSTAAFLPPSYSPWVKTRERSVHASEEEELSSLDLVSALRLVVERARTITRASGAVIALADGGEMVCRARTGAAPDLGARFHPEAGLSGECVRAATVVRCHDTESDTRVDRLVCERLGVRSIVIVPVSASNVVIGVMEVFSPRPDGFTDRDVLNLTRLADLVASMLETGLGPPEPPGDGPKRGDPERHSLEASPSTTLTERVAAAMERDLLLTEETAEVEQIAASGRKPLTPGEINGIFERFTAAAEQEDRSRRRRLLLIAAAAMIAVSVGGWGAWEIAHRQPKISNVQTIPGEPSGAIASSSRTHAAGSNPSPNVAQPGATASTTPVQHQAVPGPSTAGSAIQQPKRPAVAQDWTWKAADEPAVMAARPNDNQNLHIVSDDGSTPESANFTEGRLISGIAPAESTGDAKGGAVILRIQIGADGTVSNIRQVSGNPLLGAAAIKAVSSWRYEPYKLGGRPVAVERNVTVHFNDQKTAKR